MLPEDVLSSIFRHLDVPDKGRVSQVCKLWRDASYRKSVWNNGEVIARVSINHTTLSSLNSLKVRGIQNLRVMSLQKPLRDVFLRLPHIQYLDISGCTSVTDDALEQAFSAKQNNLLHFNVNHCTKLTGKALWLLTQSANKLETLRIGGCQFYDECYALIPLGLKNLRSLSLQNSKLTDNAVRYLSWDKSILAADILEWIDRRYGQAKSEHLDSPQSPSLDALNLENCTQLTNVSLKYISQSISDLKTLNISHCSFTGDGILHLSTAQRLESLIMHHCDHVVYIELVFTGVPHIQTLDISFCSMLTTIDEIMHCQLGDHLVVNSLENFNMSGCGSFLTSCFYRLLPAAPNLVNLNLSLLHAVDIQLLTFIRKKFKKLVSLNLHGCPNVTRTDINKVQVKRRGRPTIEVCHESARVRQTGADGDPSSAYYVQDSKRFRRQ